MLHCFDTKNNCYVVPLQTAALLVPNTPGMGGAAAVFANGGIPPAAAATAVLSIPPLYTAQPPVGDTGLPSMWGPTPGGGGGKLAPQVQDTVPVPGSSAEAKMVNIKSYCPQVQLWCTVTASIIRGLKNPQG